MISERETVLHQRQRRVSAGILGEQWQTAPTASPAEEALRTAALTHMRALKRALAQLAVDVLVDAPPSRRRASSRRALLCARALQAVTENLLIGGVDVWAPQVGAELSELSVHAAAASLTTAPPAHTLQALRMSYRALRVAMSPQLPSEMVAEGLPVHTWVGP